MGQQERCRAGITVSLASSLCLAIRCSADSVVRVVERYVALIRTAHVYFNNYSARKYIGHCEQHIGEFRNANVSFLTHLQHDKWTVRIREFGAGGTEGTPDFTHDAASGSDV